MYSVQPHFRMSTRNDRRIMRVCVGANLLVAALCATYLVMHFNASGISWPAVAAALVVGYFIADFASGLVHWGIDTWFDEATLGRAVAIAREHHTHPQNILGYGFLEHAALGSGPSALLFGGAFLATLPFAVSVTTYFLTIIWLVSSICLLFGTSFHNLSHRRPGSAIIRMAQSIHLVVPPQHHWVHHDGDQTIRYCVINGWANFVCDRLHIWRGLERLIHVLTGAQPRRDDHSWQGQYKATGILPSTHRHMLDGA